MNNHEKQDGIITQTSKRFSDLKLTQIEKIYNWIQDEVLKVIDSEGEIPSEAKELILDNVCRNITNAGIWIPEREVKSYYESKISKIKRNVISKQRV